MSSRDIIELNYLKVSCSHVNAYKRSLKCNCYRANIHEFYEFQSAEQLLEEIDQLHLEFAKKAAVSCSKI